MTLQKANKVIAEARGICWGEPVPPANQECALCDKPLYIAKYHYRPDFTTPEHYMKLMEWDKISWLFFERWLKERTAFACLSEFMDKPASVKITFIAEAIMEGVI